MKRSFFGLLILLLLCGCGVKQEQPETLTIVDNPVVSESEVLPEQGDTEPPLQPENEVKEQAEKPAPPPIQKDLPAEAERLQRETPPIAEDTVKISIKGIGDKAEILPQTQTPFAEGDTVFDVLFKITKENSIQAEFVGSKKSIYIKGIDNLYEFDNGGQSGWVYSVNGEFPKKSCGAYILKKDDIIAILYTTSQGEFDL
ncbi:MAG: DUF4430 domain-containing protein [Firmicutes bacterium]|nr:DUF4430 domain-containing protein [Bacillota bacterium]